MRTERQSQVNSVSFATLSVRALFRAVSVRQPFRATARERDRSRQVRTRQVRERDRSRQAPPRQVRERDRPERDRSANATDGHLRQVANYELRMPRSRRQTARNGLILLSAYWSGLASQQIPTHFTVRKVLASFIPYQRKELSGGAKANGQANATGPNATGPRTRQVRTRQVRECDRSRQLDCDRPRERDRSEPGSS